MTTFKKAYKYRIYPDKGQRVLLAKTFGCVRFFWNKLVETWYTYDKETNPTPEYTSSTRYRQQLVWMEEVSAGALQQKQRDWDEFRKQYFSKKRKVPLGPPQFKKKRQYNKFRLPEQKFSIKGNQIQLEKIGKVEIVIDRSIPEEARVISVTVSKNKAGQYFASVLTEHNIEQKPKTGQTVGIDVGLKDFCTTNEGSKMNNPRFLRNSQAKLSRLQMWQSKKRGSKKGEQKSTRWLKLQHRINRLYQHITNQRNCFAHTYSAYIVSHYDLVRTEDLNIQGMMKNHKLAYSIGDVGWGMFFEMLAYKCLWYGKEHEKIGRFLPSSKTCSCCGYKNKDLKLGDREWTCPDCGAHHDRDVNAAINIQSGGVRADSNRTMRTAHE